VATTKVAAKVAAKAATTTAATAKAATRTAAIHRAAAATAAPAAAKAATSAPVAVARAEVVATPSDRAVRGGAVRSTPAAPIQREVTEVVAVLSDDRRSRWAGPLSVSRRRPALYLAAALISTLGLGVLTPEEPAAHADTTTSASTSVAEALGITVDVDQPITVADTVRLQALAASRNERDAEQAAAAKVQADADRAAAEAAAAAAAEAARPDAVAPVEGGRLTSGFGGRWGRLHAGIDLAAPMMTPEYAVMDGIVLEAGPASGYGNVVYIQHDNGDVTAYGHMEEILVEPGQLVRAGDTIALLGNRGRSTGPHLHFEVHVGGLGGQKIDPLPWLRERGVDL
jgi:murein DD-endopeptidase MepM/ murein hydrolase activator NlpD